jgi:hypothetical protein
MYIAQTEFFIKEHTQFLKDHPIGPNRIFNFDESRVGQYQGKRCYRKSVVVVGSGNQSKNHSRAVETTSILPVVSASGEVLVVYYIIKGKVDNDGDGKAKATFLQIENHITRSKYTEVAGVTESGYVNRSLFEKILDDIADRLANKFPGLETLFLADNCGVHHIPHKIIELAEKKQMYINFLPPNTTHFLQPLDSILFARFKAECYAKIEEYQEAENLIGATAVKSTVYISQQAFRKVMSNRKIVEKSFALTGIYPWDPELIRSNRDHRLMDKKYEKRELAAMKLLEDRLRDAQSLIDEREATTFTATANVKMDYLYCFTHFKRSEEEKQAREEEVSKKRKLRADAKAEKLREARAKYDALSCEFTKEGLKKHTVATLKIICIAKELVGYSALKKEGLIEFILDHIKVSSTNKRQRVHPPANK